jgi:hypothetical protein
LGNELLSKSCHHDGAVQAGEPMTVQGDVAKAFSLGQDGFNIILPQILPPEAA